MSPNNNAIAAQRSRRPRILILCRRFQYGFGGVPQAVFLIGKGLAMLGVACDVAANGVLVADAGELADLPVAGPAAGLTPRRSIGAYDAIYVAGAWQGRALPVIVAAWRRGIPIIYSPKGQLCAIEFCRARDLKKAAYLAFVEIWIALAASAIHFTSELERSATWLPPFLKHSKGVTVPEPVARSVAPSDELATDEPPHLGFIAQISPRKGLRALIGGFARFCERHPESDIQLTIAGTAVAACENDVERTRAILKGHPAEARVRFVGQVAGPAREAFYEQCNLIVIPSYFESFGFVVPEALAHGCVVLAGPDQGVLEFTKGDPAIVVLRELSSEAVAEGIASVIASWSRYRAASIGSLRTLEKLAPEKIAAAVLPYLLPKAALRRASSLDVDHL